MALAEESACTEYILDAGMNFFDYVSAGAVHPRAVEDVRNSQQSFAESVAPFWCNLINGFINPLTETWTAIIDGATSVIDAIKKALSNPKKIQVAIRKITGLITAIIEKIELIIDFIVNIPDLVEDFVLKQIKDIQSSLEQYVEELRANAETLCIQKKTELIAKLQERQANTSNDAKKAALQAKIDDINSKNCTDLVSLGVGSTFQWPNFPDLVFGLGTIIESIINSFEIRLPSIRFKMPFLDNEQKDDLDTINSKIEAASTWINSKIDAANEFLKPFVTSYNTIIEFLTILSKFSLKGILKWLISLPVKIIKVHLKAVQFAFDFVIGLVEFDPISAVEDWAKSKFQALAESIKAKADEIDTDGIERRVNWVRDFIKEVKELIVAARQSINNVIEYINQKVEEYGSIFGSVISIAAQFYGFLVGGLSYAINVITAGAAPLLALLGFGTSLFSQPTAQSPNPDNPNSRNGVEEDASYEIITISGIPYGYFVASNGELVLDDDGAPIRTNQGIEESLLLPLIDPTIDLNAPDISQWIKLTRSNTEIEELFSDDYSRVTPIAQATSIVSEYIWFAEIPSNIVVDTPELPVSSVPGLNNAESTGLREEYQGVFKFQREHTFVETLMAHSNIYVTAFGRQPVLSPIRTVLEEAEGKYIYSVLNNSLVLSIDNHMHYIGVVNQFSYPNAFSKVFSNDLYAGKLYKDGEVYRLGMFDSNSNVVFHPIDNYVAVIDPDFALNNSNDPFETLDGGVIYEYEPIIVFNTVVSGTNYFDYTNGILPWNISSAHLYVREDGGEYIDYTMSPLVNNANRWGVSSVSGIYEWYFKIYLENNVGYYGREDFPILTS